MEYRFKFVSSFLDFGEEDIALIKDTAGKLAPLVPSLVEAVYTKLFKNDITKVITSKELAKIKRSIRLR